MKLKTTIITALLLVAAVGLFAQDKYEYAQLYQLDQLVYWDAQTVQIIKFDKGDN